LRWVIRRIVGLQPIEQARSVSGMVPHSPVAFVKPLGAIRSPERRVERASRSTGAGGRTPIGVPQSCRGQTDRDRLPHRRFRRQI